MEEGRKNWILKTTMITIPLFLAQDHIKQEKEITDEIFTEK